MKSADLDKLLMRLLAVSSSGMFWLLSSIANRMFGPWAGYANGIDLVFLPAGVRLVVVLICGVWGAIGIALANPLLFILNFGELSGREILLNSLISGFVPYLTVVVAARMLGVKPSLGSLRPIHLALFAVAVSVTSPLTLILNYAYFGYLTGSSLWADISVMILGDFLGCVIVLAAVLAAMRIYRAYLKTDEA